MPVFCPSLEQHRSPIPKIPAAASSTCSAHRKKNEHRGHIVREGPGGGLKGEESCLLTFECCRGRFWGSSALIIITFKPTGSKHCETLQRGSGETYFLSPLVSFLRGIGERQGSLQCLVLFVCFLAGAVFLGLEVGQRIHSVDFVDCFRFRSGIWGSHRRLCDASGFVKRFVKR